MATPSEMIVEFIQRHPEIVREGIAAGIWMMLDQGDGEHPMPMTSDQLCSDAYQWIRSGTQHAGHTRAAAAIGVIDLYFARPPLSRETLEFHAARLDSEAMRDVARKSELRERFFARAADEWRALREGPLAYAVIALSPLA